MYKRGQFWALCIASILQRTHFRKKIQFQFSRTNNVLFQFSVNPQPCEINCTCFFNQEERANVYECMNTSFSQLPGLPKETNWFIMHNNNIEDLCGEYPYSTRVTNINLASNKIHRICGDFLTTMDKRNSIREFDISNNRLTTLPQAIQNTKHVEKIRLGNNPYLCNCDTLWMVNWLKNSGQKLVQDYEKAICSNGVVAGNPIYKLDKEKLGCLPKNLPRWAIIVLSALSAVLVTVTVTILVIFKRWNEVKFWLYLHFDILDKRDEGEDLKGIRSDALVSYR